MLEEESRIVVDSAMVSVDVAELQKVVTESDLESGNSEFDTSDESSSVSLLESEMDSISCLELSVFAVIVVAGSLGNL